VTFGFFAKQAGGYVSDLLLGLAFQRHQQAEAAGNENRDSAGHVLLVFVSRNGLAHGGSSFEVQYPGSEPPSIQGRAKKR